MSGDRYIIRRFSPVVTIGGGEILDPSSYKMSHKKSLDDLTILDTGTLSEKIALKVKRAGIHGIKNSFIEGWIKEEVTTIDHSIQELTEKGILCRHDDTLFHFVNVTAFSSLVKDRLRDFHERNPLKSGMQKEELRTYLNFEPKLFDFLISESEGIVIEREIVRLETFRTSLSQADELLKTNVYGLLERYGTEPPDKDELRQILGVDQKRLSDILKLLVREGKLIRINDALYLTSDVYGKIMDNLKNFFSKKSEMTVREFKDTAPAPRKYAIHYLEYLDSIKFTKRVGDVRKVLH
jgi:selenocysteine-specific elongation factor